MFIGIFKNMNGKIENYIYFSFEEWYRDTFNPLTEIIGMLDFKIKGKNYTEKKANLEDLAKEWQGQFASYNWSYGELATIGEYFNKNGKKYGLLREFKENCIC